MAKMTMTRIREIARKARGKGWFAVSSTVSEYWCPLSLERGRQPHKVSVYHAYGEWHRASVTSIDKAFAEHLRVEWPEDRCPYVTQDEV